MKPFLTSSLAALAGALIVAGCAVAPVEGPYAYGYDRSYYYDQVPAYYDAWPGYYGYNYYSGPTIGFRFGGGDRGRHWDGGSWRHNSLTLNSGRTMPHASRAGRMLTPRNQASSRARTNHPNVARRESDKS